MIHGQKAPILGNVCMDMIMVDVTSIDCNEGDEVIVFGGVDASAEIVAEYAIPFLIVVTAISARVQVIILVIKI